MDKIKSRFNSFSGKITLIVMLGISLIAVTVSFVVLVMSRQVFTKNYGDSQEKVFEQIEKEFNDFHDHIQNVFGHSGFILMKRRNSIIRRHFRMFIRWSRI